MRRFSRISLLIAAALALAIQPASAAMADASNSGALAGDGKPLFFASAHGAEAFVGSTVHVPKVAPVSVGGGCSSVVSRITQRQRTVASVDSPPYVTSGTVHTTAAISETHGTASAEVEDAALLGGLISAETVKAVSTTTEGAGGAEFSSEGSTLVNAVVAGNLISATPPPNTRIDLPDLGYVVLNEQIATARASGGTFEVNMIHVFVTLENTLGIPVGTEIIVSHAKSGLSHASGDVVLVGMAYGVSVKAARNNSTGPIPRVVLPCMGTKGKVVEDSVLNVDASPIVVSGTLRVTAQGTVAPSSVTGETTSTVESVNLLDGMVTADLVVAKAHVSSDGTNHTLSDEGSAFTNLHVSGHPEITDSVPPNTEVSLGGWADLRLHRVIEGSNNIEVRMIEIVIRGSNSFGLPVGAVVRTAVASVGVR
jgi:hypothetical protein